MQIVSKNIFSNEYKELFTSCRNTTNLTRLINSKAQQRSATFSLLLWHITFPESRPCLSYHAGRPLMLLHFWYQQKPQDLDRSNKVYHFFIKTKSHMLGFNLHKSLFMHAKNYQASRLLKAKCVDLLFADKHFRPKSQLNVRYMWICWKLMNTAKNVSSTKSLLQKKVQRCIDFDTPTNHSTCVLNIIHYVNQVHSHYCKVFFARHYVHNAYSTPLENNCHVCSLYITVASLLLPSF